MSKCCPGRGRKTRSYMPQWHTGWFGARRGRERCGRRPRSSPPGYRASVLSRPGPSAERKKSVRSGEFDLPVAGACCRPGKRFGRSSGQSACGTSVGPYVHGSVSLELSGMRLGTHDARVRLSPVPAGGSGAPAALKCDCRCDGRYDCAACGEGYAGDRGVGLDLAAGAEAALGCAQRLSPADRCLPKLGPFSAGGA